MPDLVGMLLRPIYLIVCEAEMDCSENTWSTWRNWTLRYKLEESDPNQEFWEAYLLWYG